VSFPNCSKALEALAQGLNTEVCHDFRALRQVVTCRAWYEQKKEPFSLETFQRRMTDAWDAVRKACEAHGGMRPQIGFLTPEVSKSLPDEAYAQVATVKEIKKDGLHTGIIAEGTDGTITVCVDDKCEVTKRGEPLENLTVMLKIYGFDIED
jgi:hypothetical protein